MKRITPLRTTYPVYYTATRLSGFIIEALLKVILLLAVTLVSMNAYALCTASDMTVSFDKNIINQRDVPVGTVLATATVFIRINCEASGLTSADKDIWRVQLAPYNLDNGASTLAGVRATGVKGIGIRWNNFSTGTGTLSLVTNGALSDENWQREIPATGIAMFQDTFDLIKTDATPETDTLSTMTIAMQYSSPSGGVLRQPLFKYILSETTINTVSCQVIDGNLNVNLGVGMTSEFTGVGSTQNPVVFTIPLNCDASTSVNVTLENVTALVDTANGVIDLTSGSTAKGVGIQILYNDMAVKFGSPINYGTTSVEGEAIRIPFKARYFQTSNEVTPGTINATVTFKMTYQ